VTPVGLFVWLLVVGQPLSGNRSGGAALGSGKPLPRVRVERGVWFFNRTLFHPTLSASCFSLAAPASGAGSGSSVQPFVWRSVS
jgi:hypothetical protein